jgi:hypothetical protein
MTTVGTQLANNTFDGSSTFRIGTPYPENNTIQRHVGSFRNLYPFIRHTDRCASSASDHHQLLYPVPPVSAATRKPKGCP